jgi:chaperonin cofactor prefoldin
MRDTADFDVADFENPNSSKGLYARFFNGTEQDMQASAREGRPIFNDVELVEILAPGNSTSIVRRRVRPTDKVKFRAEYDAFKAGQSEAVSGTLLSEVPWITKSQIEEMRFMRVLTLEQLAELSDNAVARMSGAVSLKRKAREWLRAAKEAAPFTELAARNEQLEAQANDMQRRLDELEKALAKKPAASKSKPEADNPAVAE